MSEHLDPQTIYNSFAANSQPKNEGLSNEIKEYLKQQAMLAAKEVVADVREAKRLAALAKKRAAAKKDIV